MRAQPDGADLAALQRRFAGAVLQARLSTPEGIRPAAGAARERRFGVYRNNVKASLIGALAARFPVVERLVGDEFFAATALVFVERHPPRSPVLAEYGGAFAEFLEEFDPAADLPYLPDIARLEWARQMAFHSADACPVGIDQLAALKPVHIGTAILGIHPAARVVASPWPIVSLWTTNAYDATPKAPSVGWTGEAALVTRPHLDVLVRPLPAGTPLLVSALTQGIALGAAADAVSGAHESFDLATALAILFDAGAVTTLSQGSPS